MAEELAQKQSNELAQSSPAVADVTAMTEAPSEGQVVTAATETQVSVAPIEPSVTAAQEGTMSQPTQAEMPFAVVLGQAVTELPKDLYIPPQALEVFLEAFEGPLDLLLYLSRRQNLDILDSDVSKIPEQYMQYVDLMDSMRFELAAEYLLMAAMLA
ncbi:MAG: segregation/condensation protein A, partial [Pseudomonadota bacterium]